MDEPLTQTTPEPAAPPAPAPAEQAESRRTTLVIVLISLLLVAALVAGLYFLLTPATDAGTVSRIRDVFIIIMALESLLIGVVLVILILQIAQLTNLIQHEIKPILDSTNETISTLRGTSEFLSNNLAEPVIKLNEYVAAFQRLFEVLGIGRRSK
ncbi:MAG: hypothetical protein MUC85_06815 [Anaerolineales bacterium]|jgi:hypothetical protein|nr:hypothetical protein [Anaerolineales bacterium]